jgi:acyl-CoA thioester hydrolase
MDDVILPTQPPEAPPRRFRIGEFVRWSDIDLAGIICYGAYVRFFEIAESELFRSVGFPFSQLFERFDFWLPRAQLHFEFRRPAVLDDRLDIEMWIARVGRSSLRLEFEVRKSPDGEVTAEGYAVLVATRKSDLRPITLPAELVAALAPYRFPAL